VLGDMLELGDHATGLHAALAEPVRAAGADLVLLAGPHMAGLAEQLRADTAVTYRETADALKPLLLDAIGAGDVVVVKSSKGIGFSKLVDALIKQFPAASGDASPA
jgi:UDP-N-acetylmuramoyl-tripeptide--D-alanyl-D-alanine ligase